jgi:hypothetical protein
LHEITYEKFETFFIFMTNFYILKKQKLFLKNHHSHYYKFDYFKKVILYLHYYQKQFTKVHKLKVHAHVLHT